MISLNPMEKPRKRSPIRMPSVLKVNSPQPKLSSCINNVPVLQAKCACGGGCPQCLGGQLQAKLTVGPQNDMYEREADRVAEQVMRMPGSAVQRKPG